MTTKSSHEDWSDKIQEKRKHKLAETEKALRTGEQSTNSQETFLRKPRATIEINMKIERPSYHKTWDGGKALIKPFLSSHVGITPDPRSDTALAYALLVKGWGGGGGGQLMGFEIIGAQAQDVNPRIRSKNGPSTNNRPLMVSTKCRPKTRAQLSPLNTGSPMNPY